MREHYHLAITAAETMYNLWELENQQGDLDGMMRRLKDLSAYSLAHAEILDQREGIELLALAMFFGATSDPLFHQNQERLSFLSEQTLAYHGQAKIVEQEVAQRKASTHRRERGQERDSNANSCNPGCSEQNLWRENPDYQDQNWPRPRIWTIQRLRRSW